MTFIDMQKGRKAPCTQAHYVGRYRACKQWRKSSSSHSLRSRAVDVNRQSASQMPGKVAVMGELHWSIVSLGRVFTGNLSVLYQRSVQEVLCVQIWQIINWECFQLWDLKWPGDTEMGSMLLRGPFLKGLLKINTENFDHSYFTTVCVWYCWNKTL